MWEVGNEALCLNSKFWCFGRRRHPGPQYMNVYTVTDIKHGKDSLGNPGVGLKFNEFSEYTYHSKYFKKVVKPKPTAEDKEIIDIMKGETIHERA